MKFETSEEEDKKIKEWMNEHQADDSCPYERMCCHFEPHPEDEPHSTNLRYCGAAGGQFGYRFVPTGLGTTIVVYCGCGAEKNCTNYDDW